MKLYIQIKNGVPYEHPILGNNFRQGFPDVDVNNLPPEFAKFERVERPTIGIYQIYEGVTYEWVGDVVKDVHHVREMTFEEKTARQQSIKDAWAQNAGYTSWIFDEETCAFKPPVLYPTDGNIYRWNEETTSWVIVEQ